MLYHFSFNPDLLVKNLDRYMTIAFSNLVFVLMLIVCIVTSLHYYTTSQATKRYYSQLSAQTLHDTLYYINELTTGTIPFSLQAFGDKLTQKNSFIAYIRLETPKLRLPIQSTQERPYSEFLNKQTNTEEQDFACIKPKQTSIHRLRLNNRSIHDICMPFEAGGSLRVGVVLQGSNGSIYWDIAGFGLLILILLGISIGLIYRLSHYFSEPVKRLAAQLQGILNHSPLIIFAQDQQGNIHQTSQEFCQVFTHNTDPTSLNIYTLLPAVEAEQLNQMDKKVFLENQIISKDVYLHIQNELRHFFMIKFPIIKNRYGQTTLMGSIAVDTTSSRVTERTLWDYARRLEVSNRELQDFAYVASHDLQEPLRKIIAFSDRLQAKCATQLGEQGQDYIARMRNAAQRMQLLIENLLLYSRVTTRAKPFEQFDLNVLLEEVLADLEARIEETQAVVHVQSLPTLEADPTQMRQLFQNLIGNALKFHKPGRPARVKISPLPLEEMQAASSISQNLEKNPVASHQIIVEDNGIGFDEKYADRIFNIFQRLHGRDQNYEGTGVGLAICRKIIERHAGTISAHSKPGKGARFIIVLPSQQEQANVHQARTHYPRGALFQ